MRGILLTIAIINILVVVHSVVIAALGAHSLGFNESVIAGFLAFHATIEHLLVATAGLGFYGVIDSLEMKKQ